MYFLCRGIISFPTGSLIKKLCFLKHFFLVIQAATETSKNLQEIIIIIIFCCRIDPYL
jgi:hypothetical protein